MNELPIWMSPGAMLSHVLQTIPCFFGFHEWRIVSASPYRYLNGLRYSYIDAKCDRCGKETGWCS